MIIGNEWIEFSTPDGVNAASVCFIHGQPGSKADWRRVLGRLPRGVPYLSFDRPGWGTNPDGALGIFPNAEFLARLLRTNTSSPSVLVGHSFGGAVALALAVRHPELVRGLILISPVANMESLHKVDELIELPVLGRLLSKAVFVGLERSRRGASWGVRSWESFQLEQSWMNHEIAELSAALKSVTIPTVVLSGTDDRVVPSSASAGTVRELGSAEFVVVENVGHRLTESRPEEVVIAILRLLHELTAK